MSINDDKRELLKLKQGIIETSETIKEEKPQKIELHGKAKLANIYYHYKVPIFLTVFLVAIAAFLIIDYLTREQMDARILAISSTPETSAVYYIKATELETAFERYCPDFDENGNIHVDTYFVDINQSENADPNMMIANQTKLFGEFQLGVAQMIMADRNAFDAIVGSNIPLSDAFIDLSELYPDNPQIVDKLFFKVKGSNYARTANWEASCPEDIYIAVRKDREGITSNEDEINKHHENALLILDNIVNNRLSDVVVK